MKKLPLLDPRRSSYSRRDFLDLARLASAAFAISACSGGDPSAPSASNTLDAGDALPVGLGSLGGAPNTPNGRVIAALCDTVVPSKRRDPMGAIGAIDVNAPELFFDPAFPASEYLGLVALVLDSLSKKFFEGKSFTEVTPEQRETVLEEALKDEGPLEAAVQLAKVSFYSSDKAFAYLKFPGANTGYRNHPDFSFGKAMSKEITVDGNYP